MEFKKRTPAIEKNRFPFRAITPDTGVLYQGITHTLYIKKKSKKPLKTKGNKYKLQKSERFKVKSIK